MFLDPHVKSQNVRKFDYFRLNIIYITSYSLLCYRLNCNNLRTVQEHRKKRQPIVLNRKIITIGVGINIRKWSETTLLAKEIRFVPFARDYCVSNLIFIVCLYQIQYPINSLC